MILKRKRGASSNAIGANANGGGGGATSSGGAFGGGNIVATTMTFMVVCSIVAMASFATYERMFHSSIDDRLLALQKKEAAASGNLRHGSIRNNNNISNNNREYEICFITSVFTDNIAHADRVQDVTQLANDNPTFGYFGYTNDSRINMPGWTKVVVDFPNYKRMITKSRYPKFMAWEQQQKQQNDNEDDSHPNIQKQCQVVFYMDGIVIPRSGELANKKFRKLAKDILNSEYGLTQYEHSKGGGAMAEFQRIVTSKKDTPDNVIASIEWLNNQEDYEQVGKECILYENRIFGYNPRNVKFQEATSFFWNHYSLEQDSWRDQPLWCYTLGHFGIKPIPFNPNDLFKTKIQNMGHGGHHYGW